MKVGPHLPTTFLDVSSVKMMKNAFYFILKTEEIRFLSRCFWSCTWWPTKMSLFFFGNNFYKNKETFNIFSPQSLDVYRILLVETTLESIMFYYTFSVINTMFVPCTALLYDSTAATRTIKLSTTLLSISCAIRLISFLMMSSLDCGLFSQTLSFRYPLWK